MAAAPPYSTSTARSTHRALKIKNFTGYGQEETPSRSPTATACGTPTGSWTRPGNRLICVREDHTGDGEAVNTIVAIDLESGDETVLVDGHDFFASPRLAPDGRLCWLAWDHPNMPWDGCELSVATFDGGGAVAKATVIAGGRDESIAQPVWGPDGTLYFVSDRSGYWNIYRFAGTDIADADGIVSPVLVRENDFAKPAWVFGITTYDVLDASHLAVTYADRGEWRLAVLDTETGELRDVATPYTEFDDVSVAGGRVLAVAASPTRTEEIVSIDPASGAVEVLKRARELDLDERYVSIAEPIEFPTTSPTGVSANGARVLLSAA